MHDVTRGGLLETMLEMAVVSGVCFSVDYDRIPMPEVTVRFADAFQFDPIKMISSGTLLAALPPDRVDPACSALSQAGIPFSAVGEVAEGTDLKLLKGDEVIGYSLAQPKDDELARMWELYTPDTRN